MLNSRIVTITSEQAKTMLEKDKHYYAANTGNRPRALKDQVVRAYARDMKAGNWRLNGETIKLGAGHRIMDGRHRLTACVIAGVPFKTMLVNDVPHEVFDTIDIGSIRTAGDLATIAGVKHANVVAHAARIVFGWEVNGQTFMVTLTRAVRPTKPEIMELIGKHEGLQESAQKIGHFRGRGGSFLSAGIATALHYVFSQKDATLADTFFEALCRGGSLQEEDPVYHLRERLIKARMQQPGMREPAIVELIVRSWNHTRRGTKLQKIQRGRSIDKESTALSVI